MAPATSPWTVPREDRFAALVVDAVNRLEPRWGAHVRAVAVEVRNAPDGSGDDVVLASHRTGPGPRTVTLVVFRRPIELRSPDRAARVDLVRDVVAEELSAALGLEPGDLDPGYDE